jgi:WD40 repeat protein
MISLVLLPSGLLASGSCDWTVRIWNLQAGTVSVLPNLQGSWFYGLKINPFVGPNGALVVGSNYLATLSYLAFYDAANLTLLQRVTTNYSFYDIEVVPPNGLVAVGGEFYVNVYNKTGGFVSSMGIPGTIVKLRILPDNVTLVCGSSNHSLILFNVNTNMLGATYSEGFGYDPRAYSVAMLELTPDQFYLVSGGGGQILFWQWTTMSLTLVNTLNGVGTVGMYHWVSAGMIMPTTYTPGNLCKDIISLCKRVILYSHLFTFYFNYLFLRQGKPKTNFNK